MEEKLYFKPAKYGKGIKQKAKPEKDEDGGNNHRGRNLIIFLLFLVIIVLIILWLLRGKTTTSGQYPENLKTESLRCASEEIIYIGTGNVTPSNHKLEITATFNGTEFMSSMNLSYSLMYETEKEITDAEAISHADFNRKLGKRGYNAGKFNNKFTVLADRLVISLYATSSDLDPQTSDFFLLDPQNPLPTTLAEYRNAYEAQDFSCVSSLEQ